jgi:hypothetical protein
VGRAKLPYSLLSAGRAHYADLHDFGRLVQPGRFRIQDQPIITPGQRY